MPILAQVGSGDGVTKASMIPDTSSSTIMPSASVIVSRPATARACDRGSGPGSMIRQPSRSPAAAARNTADSSSIPCGRISAKNSTPRPWTIISPPTAPRLTALLNSTSRVGRHSRIPKISDSNATRTLFVHTFAANEAAGYCE